MKIYPFSSKFYSFRCWATWWSLWHMEWARAANSLRARGGAVVPEPLVENKGDSFPTDSLGHPCWKSAECMYGFIFGLSILFHWYVCPHLCQYHALLITASLQLTSEIKRESKTVFALLDPLHLPMNLRVSWWVSERPAKLWVGAAPNLQLCSGSVVILTALSPIQKRGMTFHLVIFFNVLVFRV